MFIRSPRFRHHFGSCVFLLLGLGTLLTYGLDTASYSLSKWFFLLSSAAVVAAVAACRLAKSGRVDLDRIDMLILGLLVYAGLSLLWSPDPSGGLAQLIGLVVIIALVLYARHAAAEPLAFRCSLVCVCAMAIMLLRAWFNPAADGGFGNENYFAETLLLCAPFAAYWFYARKQPDAWAGAIAIAGVAYVLFFVNTSRIEYPALAAATWAACLIWIGRRNGRSVAIAFAVVSAMIVAGAGWFLWQTVLTFDPVLERLELYANTTALWLERPIFGWGLGGFDHQYSRLQQNHLTLFPALDHTALVNPFQIADAAHNEALHFLSEAGVPGLLLLCWIGVEGVRGAARAGHGHVILPAVACAFVFLLVIGALNFPMRNPATAALAAMILGIVLRRPDQAPPVLGFHLPAIAKPAAIAGGIACALAMLWAGGCTYLAGHHHAVSQALRDRAPDIAFGRMVLAQQANPLSPILRRQFYLTYVNWVASAPDRKRPLAHDHRQYYEIARSAGPENPGILVTRLRFLLLAGLDVEATSEASRIIKTLKDRFPYMSAAHEAEGIFARPVGGTETSDEVMSCPPSGRTRSVRRWWLFVSFVGSPPPNQQRRGRTAR